MRSEKDGWAIRRIGERVDRDGRSGLRAYKCVSTSKSSHIERRRRRNEAPLLFTRKKPNRCTHLLHPLLLPSCTSLLLLILPFCAHQRRTALRQRHAHLELLFARGGSSGREGEGKGVRVWDEYEWVAVIFAKVDE